jgi:hypothetical protein
VRWRWAWDILGGQRLRSNCRTIETLRKRGEENISVAGYWCGKGYGHVRWRWAWDILGGQRLRSNCRTFGGLRKKETYESNQH